MPTDPSSSASTPTSSSGALAGAERRRDEERFRQLVDGVTDYAIFMLDATGQVSTWSSAAEQINGYRGDEIVGKHFSLFYTEDDRAAGRPQAVLDAVRSRGRFEDEGWRVRKDGTRFWASVVVSALHDERGAVLGFAKVTRDLTERRGDVERLRASEERFRLLVDGVTDYAIYMLDAKGRVTTWNRGAERMKGYRSDEVVDRDFSMFFTPEDVSLGIPQRELTVAVAEGRFEAEGYRVRKDGTRFWAGVVLTPLYDPLGLLVGFGKVTQDLTKRREAELTERALHRAQTAREAAEALATKAEEANRIKDEFLATVSHELRTPLNAIVGWASILRSREGELEPDIARAIEVIDRNARLQVKIVEDILDVSRIITGKLKIEPQPVELLGILDQAVDVVMPSVDAKEIQLSVERPATRVDVVADADRLQQAIWNLLSNAVKFTPRGGRIRVTVTRDERQASVAVADSGAGIDASFLPFVFDRFKQADGSTTRRVGGLGLGLALVRHIVEQHGGTVAATSRGQGQGAEFALTIPIRAQLTPVHGIAPAPPAAAAPVPRASPLDGVRVLVVDDEEDARELLALVLSEAGAVVEQAASSQAAFEAAQRFRPDLLLSDIGMPGESGYTLMQRLRAANDVGGGLCAIAITAYTRAEDREKALGAGFDAHFAKPVDPPKLLALIDTTLSAKKR